LLPHSNESRALHGIRLLFGRAGLANEACEGMGSFGLLIRRRQDQTDGAGEGAPSGLLGVKLFSPEGGETVVAGTLSGFGMPPGCFNPTFGFQAMESRVQRTGFDLQQLFGSPPDMFRDGVAVRRSQKEGTKDKQVESALENLEARFWFGCHCVDTLLI